MNRAAPQAPTRSWRDTILGVAILATIAVALGQCFRSETAEQKAERACNDDIMAFVMSQRFVGRELRAPATAAFPSFTADGVRSTQTQPCQFEVRGFVDAQNAFGATLRTHYSIEMRYDRDKNTWSGQNLRTK